MEAILYLDRAGCAWRYLPCDFPPWQTVYGYFAAWRDDGTLARLHDALRAQVRAGQTRGLPRWPGTWRGRCGVITCHCASVRSLG